MAKYQSRLERKLGFDPSSYFGGDVDQPRFSGKFEAFVHFYRDVLRYVRLVSS